jgi:hypothetical protein
MWQIVSLTVLKPYVYAHLTTTNRQRQELARLLE